MAARGDGGLRADAARNRDRLVAAAREVFAEHGIDVSMRQVAAQSGGQADVACGPPDFRWDQPERQAADVPPCSLRRSRASVVAKDRQRTAGGDMCNTQTFGMVCLFFCSLMN
jgi:hypothetical protein